MFSLGLNKRNFIAVVMGLFSIPVNAAPWFQDDLEWKDVNDAISNGPWVEVDGGAQISTDYAHSGSKSLKVCYAGNEHQAYLALDMPGVVFGTNNGQTHVFVRWYELRSPQYDWSGEKLIRVMGFYANQNVTLDYPLGWVANGGWGQPGTNDAGEIQMFGNSVASNGLIHFSHYYNMPRAEWHSFEYEIQLGDPGKANGSTRLYIDDVKAAEATGLKLRDSNFTLDRIWMGGWYSGGNAPEPSPACRYIDDVVVSNQRIGASSTTGQSNVQPSQSAPPSPPTVK